MDWLIDADDPHSIEQALSQIGSHLQRHAAVDQGVDGCLQALRAEFARLTPPGPGSLVRVHLDWRGKLPRAWFGAVVDPEVAAKADLRPGESVPAAHRADLDAVTEDLSANLTLDVERRVQDTFEAGIPPMAHVAADPRRDGPLSVAVALAAAAETHPTVNPAQMATLAGTALADSIAATDEPHDAASVARLWMEAHEALGSEAQVLSTDESQVGEFLGGLFGWSPNPSIEMLLAYFLYLIPIGTAFLVLTRKVPATSKARVPEAARASS
jgi:hypothetical protein